MDFAQGRTGWLVAHLFTIGASLYACVLYEETLPAWAGVRKTSYTKAGHYILCRVLGNIASLQFIEKKATE